MVVPVQAELLDAAGVLLGELLLHGLQIIRLKSCILLLGRVKAGLFKCKLSEKKTTQASRKLKFQSFIC